MYSICYTQQETIYHTVFGCLELAEAETIKRHNDGGARGVLIIVVGNGHGDTRFKSWTRLIAFHIALTPLGKVWIQLFSFQLWVNSREDWFFSLGEATSLGEGISSEFKPVKLCLKIDLVSYPARAEGLVNMDKKTQHWTSVRNIVMILQVTKPWQITM